MLQIRNFVIIAHIDHGKSTLADRFLELTGTVEKRKMHEQYLDMHPLERERGITIKMQPVRMLWHSQNQNLKIKIQNDNEKIKNNLPYTNAKILPTDFYVLNLIDTPGHVDFTYEVSRALAAVEGAVLLVDATQGVQAQTIANLHLAQKENLIIIPVINKIDLPSAEVAVAEEEISNILGSLPEEIVKISAKTGEGVYNLLENIIQLVPPPKNEGRAHVLQALVFDSLFDPYQGVIAYIRVVGGEVKKGDRVKFLATGHEVELLEVGTFSPERSPGDKLSAGDIGYLATGIKEPELVRVGDTITSYQLPVTVPLSGYREPEPMVFASIFSENQDEYETLRESLKKLKLNDASLFFEPEGASALGRGFRTGFLGMLHMEIVSERLKREYGLALTFTNPSVAFRVKTSGEEKIIYSASRMPDTHLIESIEEPWVLVEIITPNQYLGSLTTLISERGGVIIETSTLAGDRLLVRFEAPLREIVIDFYDRLKSISQGFASMSYSVLGFRDASLIRLDILVGGERIPAFSEMVPKEKSYITGRNRLGKLKDLLPRQLFTIALQAEIEGRIIARETISALRKDVTGYLYGGDRTRKMKLWKKQQKGKKRLKEMGRAEIPPEVFLKMLKD